MYTLLPLMILVSALGLLRAVFFFASSLCVCLPHHLSHFNFFIWALTTLRSARNKICTREILFYIFISLLLLPLFKAMAKSNMCRKLSQFCSTVNMHTDFVYFIVKWLQCLSSLFYINFHVVCGCSGVFLQRKRRKTKMEIHGGARMWACECVCAYL